jgi:hypothetical protein
LIQQNVVHGRIVDLRRHVNVHLYRRGRLGPAERYELWLREKNSREHQFTIHTRTMPARRGHVVTILFDRNGVNGIINCSTGSCTNYLRTDPPPLLYLRDCLVPPILFVTLVSWSDDVGLLLVLPATLLYFLTVVSGRYVMRSWRAMRTQHALNKLLLRRSTDGQSVAMRSVKAPRK